VAEPCPKCAWPVLVDKTTKREGTVRKCPQETCDYKVVLVAPEKPATAPKAKTAIKTKSTTRKAAAKGKK
jgi:DNA topoisomerase-1